MRTAITKESKMIPLLVFKIEQFESNVMKVGTRCKKDLKLKFSVARDFRFRLEKLPEDERVKTVMAKMIIGFFAIFWSWFLQEESANDTRDGSNASDDDDDDIGVPRRSSTQVEDKTSTQASILNDISNLDETGDDDREASQSPPTKKRKNDGLKVKMSFAKRNV